MYSTDHETQCGFLRGIEGGMEEIMRQADLDPSVESTLSQHLKCLTVLWPHLAELKSFRSCFCCLMFMPEKVLHCGHAVCNICIQRMGSPARDEKHAFVLRNCPLCGFIQPELEQLFKLTPPTAGIRVLCIDGGGVRGVIPLIFLKHLDSTLAHLGVPINAMFDYVCGTSAGKLTIVCRRVREAQSTQGASLR